MSYFKKYDIFYNKDDRNTKLTGGMKMKAKTLYILPLFLLFIHLFSANGNARVIRGNNPGNLPTKLYEFGIYIYDRIHSDNPEDRLPERFTRKDIQDLTGWSQTEANSKLLFLTAIGILQREGKGTRGNLYIYQLKSPFEVRENLKLLNAIRELHNVSYERKRRESVVPIVKEKIEIIKKAIELADKRELNIVLSTELEREFPELKKRFLIGLVGQDLIKLYKSFSKIKIKKSQYPYTDRVDIDYNPVKDEVVIIFPEYPIEYVYHTYHGREVLSRIFGRRQIPDSIKPDLMWNWLGSEYMRRELVYAVIEGAIRLEITLTSAEDLGFGNITSSRLVIATATAKSDLALLEKFITNRKDPKIGPLFNQFVLLQREILKYYFFEKTFTSVLSDREKEILSLRYGLEDGHPRSLKYVADIFNITRERVLHIERKALMKLRALVRLPESYRTQINHILQQAYNLLYPEG